MIGTPFGPLKNWLNFKAKDFFTAKATKITKGRYFDWARKRPNQNPQPLWGMAEALFSAGFLLLQRIFQKNLSINVFFPSFRA